jgi:membrane-anchored protein YejM (alkaline phosphatase superfamily)
MKLNLVLIFLLLLPFQIFSQKTKNIIIVTIDGVRWQEIFNGSDKSITNYCSREELMPFLWKYAQSGQLYGNRYYNNYCNVKNIYDISYTGYNEIFTGYADPILIPNLPIYNRNISFLEKLNQTKEFNGSVVSFASWSCFKYILNKKKSTFPIYCEYENDIITYSLAKNFIQKNHPRIIHIGFGDADEAAHKKKYDEYLSKINNIDYMIGEIWNQIQNDTFYKDETTLIITTDHGRGKNSNNWNSHGFWISGSSQTWMFIIGPDIKPLGEMKNKNHFYQRQIQNKIYKLLNIK